MWDIANGQQFGAVIYNGTSLRNAYTDKTGPHIVLESQRIHNDIM